MPKPTLSELVRDLDQSVTTLKEQVKGIDHVNIIADDLDATVGFYEALLGFRRGETPGGAMGFRGGWLHDSAGRPLISAR